MKGRTLMLGGLGLAFALAIIAAEPSPAAAPPADDGPLGEFFSWVDVTRSEVARRLGLDNTPDAAARRNLRLLVTRVADPGRRGMGRAWRVSSGFRAPAVNAAMPAASATSQHMKGEALDFHVDGMSSAEAVAWLARSGLPFDQAIWYDPGRGGHVHLSYSEGHNRRETLHAPDAGGYVAYRVT